MNTKNFNFNIKQNFQTKRAFIFVYPMAFINFFFRGQPSGSIYSPTAKVDRADDYLRRQTALVGKHTNKNHYTTCCCCWKTYKQAGPIHDVTHPPSVDSRNTGSHYLQPGMTHHRRMACDLVRQSVCTVPGKPVIRRFRRNVNQRSLQYYEWIYVQKWGYFL